MTLLQSLQESATSKTELAASEYADLVTIIAADADDQPDQYAAEEILSAVGKTVSDLNRDVAAERRRNGCERRLVTPPN